VKKFIAGSILLSLVAFVLETPLPAQMITGGTTSTTQTFTATGTLTVTSTGTLNVTGASTPAVYFSDSTNGDTFTVNNSGLIEQSGTGNNAYYAFKDNKGNDNIIINNSSTGTLETADSDVIHLSQKSNNVTVNNQGTIDLMNASNASGEQAVNLNGIGGGSSGGANTVNNYATGLIEASNGDAVRPGVSGFVYNDGKIMSATTNTGGDDGIDAQTNSGVTIVNGSAINGDATTGANLIEGGRHGITGGNTGAYGGSPTQVGGYTGTGSFTMSVTNNVGGTIQGDDGSGINIDGFGIAGTGSFTGKLVTNETVSVINHGTIIGNGVDGDGDGVDVDGDVNINNYGSIISENAAPEAGSPAGSVEFSEGITVGGGTITNSSTGTIEGEVTSGNTSGVGRGITLAGVDQGITYNSSSSTTKYSIPIESIYENSTITNSGLIKGQSESGITVLGTTGGGYNVTITNNSTGTIEGNNSGVAENQTISGGPDNGQSSGQTKNQAVIELDDTGNSYSVTDYGTIEQDNTTNGTAIAMYGTSNTLNIYGGSASVIGNISGATAATSTLTINPGNGNSFSYGYQISNFTVQVNSDATSGTVTLSGANTYSGGTTIKGGTLLAENTVAGTSATGTGSISNTGGVLGGFGIINPTGSNSVSVSSGGTLAPGTAGNTDTLTLNASGHSSSSAALSVTSANLTFNLNTIAGTNYASSLSLLNAYSGEVASLDNDTFTFNDLTSGHLGLGTYTLIASDTNADPFTGLTNATINGLSGDTTSLQIVQLAGTGNYALQLNITATATPEPDTWAIILAGGLGLVIACRRRRTGALRPE
jgi:hypothetical protein